MCLFYGLSHPDASDPDRSRARFFCIAPVYTVLTWFKLLPGSKRVYSWFTENYELGKDSGLRMFSLENSFRIQVFSEAFLQSLP